MLGPGDRGRGKLLAAPAALGGPHGCPGPSGFVALTEDSVSDVDALPSGGTGVLLTEGFGHEGSTSQIFFNPAAAPVRRWRLWTVLAILLVYLP